MIYYLYIWCSDCYNVDFDGCFYGDVEMVDVFTWEKEAIAEGEREINDCEQWHYIVISEDGDFPGGFFGYESDTKDIPKKLLDMMK